MLNEINKKIDEILKIVNKCPEQLREICFEILLESEVDRLSNNSPKVPKEESKNLNTEKETEEDDVEQIIPVSDSGEEIILTDLHVKAKKFLNSEMTLSHLNNIFYKN